MNQLNDYARAQAHPYTAAGEAQGRRELASINGGRAIGNVPQVGGERIDTVSLWAEAGEIMGREVQGERS